MAGTPHVTTTSDIPTLRELSQMTFHKPQQTDMLAQEIKALERSLRGLSEHDGQALPQFSTTDLAVEAHTLQESLRRTRELYDRHNAAAAPFNAGQKNRLYRLMQTEEAKIKDGNPTHEMMETGRADHVDWWRAWHKDNKVRMLACRTIRKILDPHNDEPNFGNLASITRKNELSGQDPRKYWNGYEEIAFTERVEDAIDQVSDAQYLEFLQYKALDWAPTNILRALGWTKATYETAMARLRTTAPREEPMEPPPSETKRERENREAAEEGSGPVTAAPPLLPSSAPPPSDPSAPPVSWPPLPPLDKFASARAVQTATTARRIVPSSLARAIGMRPTLFVQKCTGRPPFTVAECKMVHRALQEFDADPTLLATYPVEEPAHAG